MSILKIARAPYRRARQNELATFAAHIVSRVQGVPEYEALQNEINLLAAAYDTYSRTLAAAQNRGTAEVFAKDVAKTQLRKALDTLVVALERHANGNSQLIVEAGFNLAQSTQMRFSGQLEAPVLLKAASTGRRGEVRVTLEDAVPQAVRTHAIEVSYDQGQTWRNGTYHSHRSFTLTGLQYSPEMWLKVAAIGAVNNKSPWSETAIVGVL